MPRNPNVATAKRVAYSITEVAKMTGKNRTTIHRWLERGVLRAINISGAGAWCRRPRWKN